jgi:membrane-associated protease RseP (regulator of RpoE activity)
MNTKRMALPLAVALLPPVSGVAVEAPDMAPPATQQVQTLGGYLGVGLAPVTDEMRAQLGDTLPPGQGVMIRDVVARSPAAQSGLKPYDILLAYDDQKLYSADQLSALVRAEQLHHTVVLRLVRGGNVQDVETTIGQRQAAGLADSNGIGAGQPWSSMTHPIRPYRAIPGGQLGVQPQPDQWTSFDSLTLQKLGDGDFKVEITYLKPQGELVTKSFTGTIDTIRQQVMQQNDLPPVASVATSTSQTGSPPARSSPNSTTSE